MRMCESANKYLAGLAGAVLLYVGVMGGTTSLFGIVDIPGLPKFSAFLLWGLVVLALGGRRSCVARSQISKE